MGVENILMSSRISFFYFLSIICLTFLLVESSYATATIPTNNSYDPLSTEGHVSLIKFRIDDIQILHYVFKLLF